MIGRKAAQLDPNVWGGIRAVKEQYVARLQATQNLTDHF